MKRIIDKVYTFTGLLVGRVYCIVDDDGLTLIDAALPTATAAILTQIAQAGYSPSDIKRILITHAHPDHVGALPALKAATGAQIISSADEQPFVEGARPIVPAKPEDVPPMMRFMTSRPQTMKGTPVDRTVHDGDILADVLGGLHVVATPGHSPGHISFWQPERGILFTGDVLMHLAGLRLPFAAFTTDMRQNKASLGRIAALKPSILCFGHGTPLTQDTAARLQAFADANMLHG
jgi:glyoxylase-like metal-dependent hydrolase (beta-lactamase superfamily II)